MYRHTNMYLYIYIHIIHVKQMVTNVCVCVCLQPWGLPHQNASARAPWVPSAPSLPPPSGGVRLLKVMRFDD